MTYAGIISGCIATGNTLEKVTQHKGEASTEASLMAARQAVWGWSQGAAEEALAMLQASSDDQRIVEAAGHS